LTNHFQFIVLLLFRFLSIFQKAKNLRTQTVNNRSVARVEMSNIIAYNFGIVNANGIIGDLLWFWSGQLIHH